MSFVQIMLKNICLCFFHLGLLVLGSLTGWGIIWLPLHQDVLWKEQAQRASTMRW